MIPAAFRVFAPLANEWAAPYPAILPTTKNAPQAALFASRSLAAVVALRLMAAGHEWVELLPVFLCRCCGGEIEPGTGTVSGDAGEGTGGLHYSWYKGEFPGLPHLV